MYDVKRFVGMRECIVVVSIRIEEYMSSRIYKCKKYLAIIGNLHKIITKALRTELQLHNNWLVATK